MFEGFSPIVGSLAIFTLIAVILVAYESVMSWQERGPISRLQKLVSRW